MENKKSIQKLISFINNLIEIYIPSAAFIMLFVSFIIGIIWRYILKDPQSWTFEVSSICYLAVGILSWGIAHRTEEHIVFDMLYLKCSPAVQCVMRIISNLMISITSILLIAPSVSFMEGMKNLTTQIIHIPRYLVFLPFAISFFAAFLRSGYRCALDIYAFYLKDYKQLYGKMEEGK